MSFWTRRAGIVPVVAAFAVVLSGCELEVLNPGAIQDADLTDPSLMPVLVNGVSAEYNDFQDDLAFDVSILSDEMAGTGSYSGTQQYRQGDFDWDNSLGNWASTHEASWSADQAILRLQEVSDAEPDFEYTTSQDAARAWAIKGFANVRLGENFCFAVYGVGSASPRTAAFDTAIAAFNQAITLANSSGADEWELAALAGIAQAELGKAAFGGGTWGAADAAAAAALTAIEAAGEDLGWADYAIYNAQADENLFWTETWGRAEYGMFRTLGEQMHDQDEDPRVAYKKCGEWNDPDNLLGGGTVDPRTLTKTQLDALIVGGVTPTGDCDGEGSGAHQGADGEHAHYKQTVYSERGSDIPRASAHEMLLIRAEAAMMSSDFDAMVDFINEVREDLELDPYTTVPTALGTLDYPHDLSSTEAIDILDRERYATLFMQGRRLFDQDRWDHPYLEGGDDAYGPGLGNWVVGGSSFEPRRSCMPIPKTECLLNTNISDDATVCTG
jgi:tetratricopeptide (TPR) repeat protein